MVIRYAVVVLLGFAAIAHADSAKLAEARKALDDVRYDDAQRLLVAALEEGGNSPAAVREIYKLSASTAVVMGQGEVGEQYYRRWLALDPSATLSNDVAPKLRAPFEAARAYIAAHGRLDVSGSRTGPAEIELAIVADPLAMARAARVANGAPATFDAQQRVRVGAPREAVDVVILDQYGNTLLALAIAASTGPIGEALPELPPPPSSAPSRTWMAFGVPAAIFLIGGLGAGTYAYLLRQDADAAAEDSGQHYFADVDDKVQQSKLLTYVGGGAAALGLVLAIPAAILYTRTHGASMQVLPATGDGTMGLAVTARF